MNKDTVLDKQVGGDHYRSPYQVTKFCHDNELTFIEGNIIKYVVRHNRNGGEGAEDIKKLIHYAEMILEWEYGQSNSKVLS